MLTVSVPEAWMVDVLAAFPDVETVLWDLTGPSPRDAFDLVVVPYMSSPSLLHALDGVRVGVVQAQSIGYDGVAEVLPSGVTFCNARGVHEAATAELAVGLMIASQRQIPDFVRAQDRAVWAHVRARTLADSHVLVLGAGGVGNAVVERLRPFEVTVTRVGRRARAQDGEQVYATESLPELLPTADIVVVALPLTDETNGLVDAGFLSRMKQGALLVNVGRGASVVTDDLVAAVADGRVRAALDVVDPEPLPPGHPLWTLDDVLLTPHVGGDSAAMQPRVERLIRRQVETLIAGREPINVVLGPA
jgi:phosphoglycerate dehydrogenase-like enzyme